MHHMNYHSYTAHMAHCMAMQQQHNLMQLLCLLQILTHVKEKLQFAQKEKEGMQVELDLVEAALVTHRDDLSRVKLVRDKAILATRKLRDAGSQVTSTALLADLEVWDHTRV